jgi:hypothetical protein
MDSEQVFRQIGCSAMVREVRRASYAEVARQVAEGVYIRHGWGALRPLDRAITMQLAEAADE